VGEGANLAGAKKKRKSEHSTTYNGGFYHKEAGNLLGRATEVKYLMRVESSGAQGSVKEGGENLMASRYIGKIAKEPRKTGVQR